MDMNFKMGKVNSRIDLEVDKLIQTNKEVKHVYSQIDAAHDEMVNLKQTYKA